jgi:predicted MFS family arabinose efflux permease
VSSFEALLAYRLVAGVGAAMMMPSVWATVGSIFPPKALMSAMSVVWAFISLSMIIGVPIASFLAGDSWKAMFWGTAGLSLPLVVALAFLPLGQRQQASSAYLEQFRKVLRHSGARRSLAATFFWNLSLFGTFSLAGAFYFANFALDTRHIGIAMLLGGLGTFGGTLLARRLGSKLDRRRVVRLCALGCAVCVAPFTLALSLSLSIVLQIVWSTFVGFGAGALSALVSAQQPSARGTVMSLNSAILNGSVAVGGALSGRLVELGHGHFGLVGIMSSVAAIAVTVVVPDAPAVVGAKP